MELLPDDVAKEFETDVKKPQQRIPEAFETPLGYAKLFFYSVLYFIFNNQIVFYISLIALFVFLIFRIFKMFKI